MKILKYLLWVILILTLQMPLQGIGANMQLTSPAFDEGKLIPVQYTCKGENESPPLAWVGEPTTTKTFALIVEDPDAPKGTYTHWVAFNIPASIHAMTEGQALGVQGLNSFGKNGYGGPCPPQGHGPHRYYFKLLALDQILGLSPGASKNDLESAMQGHILDQAELMGRFEIK